VAARRALRRLGLGALRGRACSTASARTSSRRGTGHLNLSLVLLPPLVLLLAHELYVRQSGRAVLTGALLGVVAMAQLLTTEEVLASTFVMGIVGTAVLALQHRHLVRARLRHALVGLGTAAGVLTVLAAWPLSVQFTGPRRITESVQDTSPFAADLLGTVVPTIHQALGTDATIEWGGNDSENGSYLGLPLLVVLLALGWRFRSVAVVRWAAVVGLVAWVLSLGSGCTSPAPRPAADAVPAVHDAARAAQHGRRPLQPVRRAALGAGAGRRAGPAARLRQAAAPGRAAVALLCVVPLVPAWPYSYQEADAPPYFSSSAVEALPEGAVALTFPVPRFPASEPMLWQAQAGFRYRSVGGYAYTPTETAAAPSPAASRPGSGS
jgi:hypothetical protein